MTDSPVPSPGPRDALNLTPIKAELAKSRYGQALIDVSLAWAMVQEIEHLRASAVAAADLTKCTCGARECLEVIESAALPRPRRAPEGETAVSGAPEALNPPAHIVELAVEVSGWSPCQSKRGVVIFDRENGNVVSHGHNHKPKGFECDGSDACKATCRIEAIHAEQDALMHAPRMPTDTCDMLHVKTVDGKLVPSDAPSCVQCSKLALAGGVKGFWLFHEDGWKRYDIAEFHRLSLRSAAPVVPLREAEQVCPACANCWREIAQLREQLATARAALFRLTSFPHTCALINPKHTKEFCVPCIAQRALDEVGK